MKKYKNILKDRNDAAQKLTEVIPMQRLKDENWKLISVSRGGLELAYNISKKYKNSIDFLFSESIKAPNNSECEIARVSESEEIVINEKLVSAFNIQYDYIYGEARRKHEEKILSYIYQYRKGQPFASMHNQVVLLVDEGSETGMKFMTALKTILAQKPKAVYIAVPVIPSDVLELLEPFADDIFFLYSINDYVETSLYYEDFEKVDEERIEKLLGDKNEI
ncbi:MAG: phosphoribosyltransferase family protein [Sulfurimonas sp.]|uniref:phosphoribosyltransferase n=1 Tax=Sulfurimonas sp. TaxID=2022749 RepID=UPI00260E6753|nr:phosphoribosyltransferase family protein [Sulfurimonas sp.]MCW8894644.1 phosphoribosyltransferase family protein [Sulfurimonas sp.]MCW8955215.1 phosphoribosyltransferase family protein [Sulfurimonas sp.]MCW9067210.1 phosphoribosyltransferase family protein [Sulfurimonas sp.]